MWRRLAESRLLSLWRQFPAVLILGARQVGKTTVARRTFPSLTYCDLENPNLRQLFSDDPVFQIESRMDGGLILDEAQSVPDVFPALRGIIDRTRSRRGRFLLLGSSQPSLVRGVSESLAGRVGILELDPLTAAEVQDRPRQPWKKVWLHGGFPDALRKDFREWWESYLRTYIERDLPHLGVSANPLLLRRLLTMLAHMQGGLLNASSLGNSLGVSYHTVSRYLDVLEQTFLIRRLQPYHRNIGKRLTKSPKVYLRDCGLLHHLLNIGSTGELQNHPAYGASWETFVIEEIIRREQIKRPGAQAFFWRTAAGSEIDLVLDRGSHLVGIEIKAGTGARIDVARQVEQANVGLRARKVWVIDHGAGQTALKPDIQRRGMFESFDWLP